MATKTKTIRFYVVLLALFICCEAGAFSVGDYTYSVLDEDAKTVSVRCKNSVKTTLTAIEITDEVTDPNSSITYKVTKIENNGFYQCTAATSVTIGNNITRIGSMAFQESHITSVVIPASVNYIGEDAFRQCYFLKSVTFDEASELTSVQPNAFYYCKKLVDIVLPPHLTSLSSQMLFRCEALTTITLPASISSIAEDAFMGSSALATIIYEGATAPNLVNSLSTVSESLRVHVLSTAAKESFEASNTWMASVAGVDIVPLAVSETADNSATLEHHKTHTADVELTRTIRHESYNALCLPFALSAEQVANVFGADCDIEELTSASISEAGIDMVFTARTTMEAGKPYLVQPKATVPNPSFTNVVLTDEVASTSLTDVDFIGVFSQTEMTANENILLLGAENTLSPTGNGTLNGLRGYFVLKSSKAQAAAKKQARIVVNSSGETALEGTTCTETITKRIVDGQLVITREGVHYNACGTRVQ